jgi:bifunctional non-homologous end joining protein LigD
MGKGGEEKLAAYRRKRDFLRTTEPAPGSAFIAARQLVVQHHYATREHFDLRLEIGGVLVSWAVTRGPSANPCDKRLAVRTEDHPLSYATFEGVIPKGQYGGGTVVLWEHTSYTPLNGPPEQSLAKGEIKFESHGERLQGRWVLVRMKGEEKRENWLLIKERDAFVEDNDSLSGRYDSGVVSGLKRSDIEAGKKAVPKATAGRAKETYALPHFINPQLCESASEVPAGQQWAYELKYDGYRLQVAVADHDCRIYTRTGLDWTSRFQRVATHAKKLACKSCLLDGEAVVLSAKGLSDFPGLVAALERQDGSNIVFVAFDVLFLDGEDLRSRPYVERKRILRKLVPVGGDVVRYGDFIDKDGEGFFRAAVDAGAEGIIAKDVSAPYASGRSNSWRKIKGDTRHDSWVIGYMPSTTGESFASLLGADKVGAHFRYAGRIGTGFTAAKRRLLAPHLESVSKVVPSILNRDKLPGSAVFLTQPFPAEIRHKGWTADKQLRQASFISIQGDRMDAGQKPPSTPSKSRAAASKIMSVSHPDRVIFPAVNVTKGDIAAYYEKIWPRLAPHLDKRPVSLLRAPDGIAHETFFQRHPLSGMKHGLQVFGSEREQYFALEGKTGLLSAIQFGTIELHGWNAVLPNIDRPDRMVFDLDPDEAMDFKSVARAAMILRDYLLAAGLESWPLLSGGKGIHIVVPLSRKNDAEAVEAFCKAFAHRLAADRPQLFIASMSKAKRHGKIFIDYLRNRTKSTAILPWSLRARAIASIAAPVSWKHIETAETAAEFSIKNVLDEDGWTGFWRKPQMLSKNLLLTVQDD